MPGRGQNCPRRWSPRSAGLGPQHCCLPISDPVIGPHLTPAKLSWEADDIRSAPGSHPPPGRQTGLYIWRKRSPVTLQLQVAFCFPCFPRLAPGLLLPILGALGRWKGRDPPACPWALCTCQPGPEPSGTWPTFPGLPAPTSDPMG